MKRRPATVIDPGVGNLGNLERALRTLDSEVEITTDGETVAASRCLLLPGVGAFRPPRERLRGELEDAIGSALAQGAWLLGICVGYQLLFEESSEFGTTDGLGLLQGRISELPADVQRPHIGWNRLHDLADHPLLAGIEEGEHAYFVHSFAPQDETENALARCTHGSTFTAVAGSGRVLGTQFHPEKSGQAGLLILDNFLEIASGAAASHRSA